MTITSDQVADKLSETADLVVRQGVASMAARVRTALSGVFAGEFESVELSEGERAAVLRLVADRLEGATEGQAPASIAAKIEAVLLERVSRGLELGGGR